ncbi:SLC13 family permease [Halioxenophilus sp. WMMB6]|uniref:SLC13 family permease n=1 Tax=Halioxenophilus sp. WMMB6 TaxID=3073815 RepID=UPI00295E366A|nr:SLC13 family permease [Halioxenophilus sp. WMMB6]
MSSWIVLGSIVVLLALLVSGKVKPAILFCTWAFAYLAFGLVDSSALLSSFANPGLATLLLLLLVSLALERSPLLEILSTKLLLGPEGFARLKLMVTAASLSAFLNNTAVVASFLSTLTKQTRFAPSRLLIPLSYASVLGGITTLVGTSTNLVVDSFAVEAGLPEFSMFQFSQVGIPVAIAGLIVVLISSRFLPKHRNNDTKTKLNYFVTAEVNHDSAMAGLSIEANKLRGLQGLYLLEIERDARKISPVTPDEILEPGDRLLFTGEVEQVQTLQKFPGLTVFGTQAAELLTTNLVEVVIAHESELPDKTLQEVDFRTMFNAGVVGIRRGEKQLRGQLGRIPLRVGDSLLLAIGPDFFQHRNIDRNFHVLSGSLQYSRLNQGQSIFAMVGFAAVIALSALGWLPLFTGLALLLGLFLATRLLSVQELRRRFPFELMVIIGSALTLAKGMDSSGAADLIATFMQTLFNGYGPQMALVGIFLMTLVLTELITNNAAAALVFPVALSTAQGYGVDPMPFVMAVAYGASACFLIPFGYQTHLMVYSPGHYQMLDFIKTGLPLTLVYCIGVLLLVPWAFPF